MPSLMKQQGISKARMGERLLMARRSCGLSQEALATRLGIRRAAVSQWEHPEGTLPSVVNLLQTALETEVSFEWLATGRGSMKPPREEIGAFSTACIAQCTDEEQLLAAYRAFSYRQRTALLGFLGTLGDSRAR